MANLAQMYGYNTDWKPGGSLGGFLASQRENELELARLMELYNSAQQLQKQKQDYNYKEQMNPLELQGKGLANTTAQQTLDINQPKAAKALAQINDPTWLPGEMESDRLKGRAQDTENISKTATNKRATVMSLLEKWSMGNISPLEIQYDIQQFAPEERQAILEASKNPQAALEIMLEQDAQRSWSKDKVKTTQNNLNNLEIANMNNETRRAIGTTPRPGSNRPLNAEQRYVKYLDDLLESGQIDQPEFDRLWADYFNKKYGPKVQQGMTLGEKGEGQVGLVPKEQPAITTPTRKGAPEEAKTEGEWITLPNGVKVRKKK